MNQNSFLAFAAMFLAIVYLLVWNIELNKYDDMAMFIPDNALFYTEQTRITDLVDDLGHSKLGREVRTINYLKIAWDINLSQEKYEILELISELFSNGENRRYVKEILGNKAAFAILQPDLPGAKTKPYDFFKENSVLITKPLNQAHILQIFGAKQIKRRGDLDLSIRQYGEYHIWEITRNESSLFVVEIDGYLLFSFEENLLEICINTIDSELPALADFEEFSTLKSNYDQPDWFSFLSIENSKGMLETLLADNVYFQKLAQNEFDSSLGFSGISYGAWKNKTLLDEKILVLYHKEMVRNIIENQFTVPPSKCDTLRLSPENPIAFFWSNTTNFELLYRLYLKGVIEKDEKFSQISKKISSISGIELDNFFELLGTETTYMLSSGHKNLYLPATDGIIFIKTDDPEKLRFALKKLVSHFQIPLVRHVYEGYVYYSWVISPKDGLEPLYGFMDNYLFLGNSSNFFKQIADNNMDGSLLLKSAHFKEIGAGLNAKNNSISYTNNIEIIKIFGALLDFTGTLIALENREYAQKIKIIIEGVLKPFLEALSTYERTATRSYFSGNMVIVESKTKIVN